MLQKPDTLICYGQANLRFDIVSDSLAPIWYAFIGRQFPLIKWVVPVARLRSHSLRGFEGCASIVRVPANKPCDLCLEIRASLQNKVYLSLTTRQEDS